MTRMTWIASGVAVALVGLVVGLWFGVPEKSTSTSGGGPVAFNKQLAAEGKGVAEASGCASCHSATGGTGAGPTWQGIYGATIQMADGKSVKVDGAYIKEAILQPTAAIREGFGPSMPSYQDKVSDAEVAQLTEYIKSLAG